MVAIPWQRPSPDLRTVTLTPRQSITEVIEAARDDGWFVVSARRVPGGLELVLGR